MRIQKDKWVSFHYTVKDESGNVLDSSFEKEPLGYLHGNGTLIVGLEKQLEGKEPGDKFSTVVQPSEGYGEIDSRLRFEVDKSQFEFDGEIQVGMMFSAMTPQGPSFVRVTKVDGEKITIDGNHELAGKVLDFYVEVVDVRDATEEEPNASSCGGGCGGCSGGCGGNCSGDCGGDCGGNCSGDCNSGCGCK